MWHITKDSLTGERKMKEWISEPKNAAHSLTREEKDKGVDG
jgi:hypothetical protein